MSRGMSNPWRWAATGGAAFVALDLLALLLPGTPIRASDSAAHTAAVLTDHRGAVLAATLIGGLAALALLVFAGAVRQWLEENGPQPGLSAIAFGAPLLAIGLELAGFALFFGATFRVASEHQDALVRALTDAGNSAFELAKFPIAAFIGSICVAARTRLPGWTRSLGALAAALLLASTTPLVSQTPLVQMGGPVDLLGSAPALIWLAYLSVRLVVQPPETAGAISPRLAAR
jgi:hypothetical protein